MAEKEEQADGDGPSDPSGGWFGSWFQTAKEKSAEVLGYIRQDFGELSVTVQNEVQSATSVLKDKLKFGEESSKSAVKTVTSSVSSFFGQVSSAFAIPPDSDEEAEEIVVDNTEPIILNRLQAEIYTLTMDPQTYLVDISKENQEDYDKWQSSFDLEDRQNELPDLLVSNDHLQKNYVELVPDEVSHSLFWHRYFYRVHCAEQKEQKRQAVKKRVDEKLAEDRMNWEDENEFGENIEIPEEEQMRLLEEYERECKEKGQKSDILADDLPPSASKTDAKSIEVTSLSSATGSQKSNTSNSASNDDEWEKEFDIDEELKLSESSQDRVK